MSHHQERTSWLLEECTFDFCEGTFAWSVNDSEEQVSNIWLQFMDEWLAHKFEVGVSLEISETERGRVFGHLPDIPQVGNDMFTLTKQENPNSFYKVLVKRKSELFHSSVARPDSGSAVRRVNRKRYSFISHTDGNSFPCCGHTPWLHVVSCLTAGLKHLNTMCTIKLASGSFNPNTAFSSWLFKY